MNKQLGFYYTELGAAMSTLALYFDNIAMTAFCQLMSVVNFPNPGTKRLINSIYSTYIKNFAYMHLKCNYKLVKK